MTASQRSVAIASGVALAALLLTIGAVTFVNRFVGPQIETAVKIVGGVVSAVSTGFGIWTTTRALTNELGKSEQVVKEQSSTLREKEETLQKTTAQLAQLERDRVHEVQAKEERARETYEAILAKCNAAPKLENIHWKDAGFIRQLKFSDQLAAKTFEEGARLVVVASGKGGVGKSTLSLGLTEAFSRDDRVLLVDFDLHNRGLTSLLFSQRIDGQAERSEVRNVLREMERFSTLFNQKPLLDAVDDKSHDAGLDDNVLERFKKLRNDFASPGVPLGTKQFAGTSSLQPGSSGRRAFFWPSTGLSPQDRFLASTVFRRSSSTCTSS